MAKAAPVGTEPQRPLIALRPDAGWGAGLGHVHRCLALATALMGWADCHLLLAGSAGLAAVRPTGLPWTRVADDVDATLAAGAALGAEALVIDSYRIGPGDLEWARNRFRLLAVLDDAGTFPSAADLVVNPAAGAGASKATGSCWLVGPSFAPLGAEFAAPPRRPPCAEVHRILLVLGATPPAGLLVTLAKAIRRAAPHVVVDVVVGPDDGVAREAEASLAALPDVVLHRAPEHLRPLMERADLAVSAGGVTLLELAATAVPTVGVCVAQNQEANLAGLVAEGAVVSVGSVDDRECVARVGAAVASLVVDVARRTALGMRARAVVDGRGADRVAAVMRARLAPPLPPVEPRRC